MNATSTRKTRRTALPEPVAPPADPPETVEAAGGVVETLQLDCPDCHATTAPELSRVERRLPGISPSGHDRSHIVWIRRLCPCGRVFVTIEHQARSV